MAATKQSQAVGTYNDVLTLVQQMVSLRDQAAIVVAHYNRQAASTTWAAFATAALSADGSLGTVDVSPIATHPIDTRVITGAARAALATDVVSAVTALSAFGLFCGNGVVPQLDRSALLDTLVGG